MFNDYRLVKYVRDMSVLFNNKNNLRTPVFLYKGGFCGNDI